MAEFTGKTVLITGATSGIGRATAQAFFKLGATVGVNHLGGGAAFGEMREQWNDTSGRLIELEADVSNSAAVQHMLDTLVSQTGQLDVLVNNAGISQIKPFMATTEDDWDHLMKTDLKSVFLCCRAALPHLLKTGGAIINMASELALAGRAQFAPYTAAKGAIISLTRSLALEFAPTLRINAVAPGPTQTPMLEAEARVPGHDESLDSIPLGRYAEPWEIAETIVFLASPRAGYYTGALLSPNGGTVPH